MVLRLLLTSIAVVLFPYFCFASFIGPVVSVLDGDTIEVLHNTHPERIRLSGIDCPEKGQAFGNRAKQAASALVFGRDVILQTHGQDKYGRTLPMYSCAMAPTSITNWSKTAGAGGTGSMRLEIRCLKGWRRKHERRRKACGLIRSRCRRGSGGSHEFSPTDEIRPFPPLIILDRSWLTLSVLPTGDCTIMC